ncbi:MAG: PqiC family protein [Holophaga sp.]|nr:PqiC family protein [Holophaga sp.]
MTRPLLPVLLLAATLGCLGLKTSPSVLFHTLQPLQLEGPPPAPSGLAVEILPVRLPELLQRPQLVLAEGPGGMGLSDTHRWGNPLDQDMQRVLVQNLGLLLGSEAVVASPYGERVAAGYRVELEVRSCQARDGALLLDAVWMVTRPGQSRALLVRPSLLREALPDSSPDALAAAHSRIMADLSREIAAALLRRP